MLEAHCKSDDLNTRAAALEAVKLFKNTKGSFTDAQLRHPFAVVLHPDRNPARKPHEVCALFNRKEVSVEDQRKEQAAVQAYWAQREAEQKAKRKAQRERRKAEKAAEQKRQAGSA